MLSFLADYSDYYGPLRVLRYITVRTLGATGTAAIIGFIIGPWLIRQLRRLKFGQHYDDDRTGDLAHRFDKKNTPTMGGLLIFACVFLSSLLWAAPNIWVVVALFVYAALTGVGFRDDCADARRPSGVPRTCASPARRCARARCGCGCRRVCRHRATSCPGDGVVCD